VSVARQIHRRPLPPIPRFAPVSGERVAPTRCSRPCCREFLWKYSRFCGVSGAVWPHCTSRKAAELGAVRRPSAEQQHVLAPRDSACRLSDPATPGPNVGPRSKRRLCERRCDDETHSSEGHHLVDRCCPWCAWAPRSLWHCCRPERVLVLARHSRARLTGVGDTP